jgi:hypothetical protein
MLGGFAGGGADLPALFATARDRLGELAALGEELAALPEALGQPRTPQVETAHSASGTEVGPGIVASMRIADALTALRVDARTLVCIDLDDVLLCTAGDYGSESWEAALAAELEGIHGVPAAQAERVAGQLWRGLLQVVDFTTPEPGVTADVVVALQQRAVCVLGLTARDRGLIPVASHAR